MALALMLNLIMIVALLLNNYTATCRNVNLLRNEFGIHGLWPGRINRTEPLVISPEDFNDTEVHIWFFSVYYWNSNSWHILRLCLLCFWIIQIANLKPYLLTKWYNARDVTTEADAKFLWIHEWKNSTLTLSDYFSGKLQLFDKINNTFNLAAWPFRLSTNPVPEQRPRWKRNQKWY